MNNNDFFLRQTPSSRIKASIVAKYFPKYCRIINKKKQKEIRYLDLYAGPGIYKDGNPSTPILIAEACSANAELREIVHLMFNDNTYIEDLKRNFYSRFPTGTFKKEPRFADKTVGDDNNIDKHLMGKWGSPNLTPTLLFVDPFGYKSINTIALGNFMNGWGNEIFLFLNVKRIQAALDNGKFDILMDSLFPTTAKELRKDRKYKASTSERLNLIVANLSTEIKKLTKGTLYDCRFKFMEEDSIATSHYIIHFTKHSRGYDLVKQIYNEFDNIGACLEKDGSYTFDAKKMDLSDNTFNFGNPNIEALSDIIYNRYRGQTINAKQLFEQHHTTGQFAIAHYRDALRRLVDDGKLNANYTDGRIHSVTVLINEYCELNFK